MRGARAAAANKSTRWRGSGARLRVSAGENVEFFRGARRGAFACKCVSAAGSELTVARRRRKESLPPLAMLRHAQRRLARAQASRASIVLEARTGNWWPRSSFSEAPRHRSSFLKLSYSPSLGYPPQSAARTSKTQPGAGRPPGDEASAPRGVGGLRIDPETYTRAETRPLDFTTRTTSQSFARAHKTPIPHATRDRTQRTARHHANDAPSLAAAAGHEGSPLVKRSRQQGSLA